MNTTCGRNSAQRLNTMTSIKTAFLILLSFLLLSAGPDSLRAQEHSMRILAAGPQHLRLHMTFSGPPAAADSTAPSWLVVLPPAGDAVLQVSGTGVQPLARAAAGTRFPARHARLQEQGWWRGFRLARLQASPVIARDGTLLFAPELDITLKFPENTTPSPLPLTPEEEKFLRRALNAGNAANLRARRTEQPAARVAQADLRFKISTPAQGMYSIRFADLARAGLPQQAFALSEIRLSNKGRTQPLHFFSASGTTFAPGDSLWFFAERHSGEDSYFDDEVAENIYWLEFGGLPGRRFVPDALVAPNRQPEAAFRDTLHLEQDLRFYSGDDETAIYTSDRVSGEGWVWAYFFPGDSLPVTFSLPSPAATATPAELSLRVRGISKDPVRPNHRLQIELNGTLIADTLFSNTETVVLRRTFAAELLQPDNRLRVISAGGTGAQRDKFYLDWLEISYDRTFSAQNDYLLFHSQEAEGDSTAFLLSGFSSDRIFLFDLTTGRTLTGARISEDSGTFQLAFTQAGGQNRRYLALTPAALRRDATIRLRPPDELLPPSNSADMLIITHADFRRQAERLAQYRREHSGLRTRVIDVEMIYDSFGHGFARARALRSFFRYVFNNWQPPLPRYVLLVGDASWDPKRNMPTSSKRSFIPSFGNPVSDSRLVCIDGPEDVLPDFFIGRLAVEQPQQAELIIDKIISYENGDTPLWSKAFTFLNGGIDGYERALFAQASEKLIRDYVQPVPVAGTVTRLYKTSDGRTRGELLPEILDAFAKGTMIFTFNGHAGSRTWELMMLNEDIPLVDNAGRLPFVVSMTCHTARFANPFQNSFAEDFMLQPERGSAAFWGTSGWGFVFQDGILQDGVFKAIAQDTVRQVGVATTFAKLYLWQKLGARPHSVSVIDQYTLLSDPALTLPLPRHPELALLPEDIRPQPAAPTTADSILSVSVAVRNLGLAALDSTTLTLQISPEAQASALQFQHRLPPVARRDSARFFWQGAKTAGVWTLQAEVSPPAQTPGDDPANNRARRELVIRPADFIFAAPADLALTDDNTPELHIYPEGATGEMQYIFEVDSSREFDSPLLQTSAPLRAESVRLSWQVREPLPEGTYFWRVRHSESTPQSQRLQAFTRSPAGGTGMSMQGDLWAQAGGDFSLLRDAATAAPAAETLRRIDLSASAHADTGFVRIVVDGELLGGAASGMAVLAFSADSLQPGTLRLFSPFTSTASRDSLIRWLEGLAAQTPIVAAAVRPEATPGQIAPLAQAFARFGSNGLASLPAGHAWVFSGIAGLSPGAATERSAPVSVALREPLFHFKQTSEVVSPEIGPARAWQEIRLSTRASARGFSEPAANTALTLIVEGRRSASQPWRVLLQDSSGAGRIPLQIDAGAYPTLRLRARFRSDAAFDAPALQRWQVIFERSGDWLLHPAVQRSAAEALPGQQLTLSAQVFAFDLAPTDSALVRLYAATETGAEELHAQQRVPAREQGVVVNFNWQAVQEGTARLRLAVDADGRFAEPFEFNNQVALAVPVRADSTAAVLAVYFDGEEKTGGEFIAAEPVIEISIRDDSPAATVFDRNRISLRLDGARVQIDGEQARVLPGEQPGEVALIRLQPQLAAGEHTLEVVFVDQAGRRSALSRTVRVSDALRLQEVINHPNPLQESTTFTFILSAPAEMVELRIYTLSGRRIRTLQLPAAEAGFNTLPWDGRDASGDYPANGIYLYKLIARDGQKQVSTLGKLAIAR